MKTYITDTFPLDELECQYFDVCRCYNPSECSYSQPCNYGLLFEGKMCKLRTIFRQGIADFQSNHNLATQINLIMEDDLSDEEKE